MNLLCLRWVIWAMNLNSHDILFSIFVTLCLLGNDPLTDEENNHDINSVAGVLKLYFRGLENPLFPKERFSDLISCISKCLISLVFNFLLTCSCKSVIDSQCELTVLWTVFVRSHIKRSQSFAPNSGTVTFWKTRRPAPQANANSVTHTPLLHSVCSTMIWHIRASAGPSTGMNATLCEFERVQKACFVMIRDETTLHWMNECSMTPWCSVVSVGLLGCLWSATRNKVLLTKNNGWLI